MLALARSATGLADLLPPRFKMMPALKSVPASPYTVVFAFISTRKHEILRTGQPLLWRLPRRASWK